MAVQAIPTIKDIARQLNVSVSTVSRALKGHKSIGLRTQMRVKQLASELRYQPNLNAISFKQKRTFIIGVLIPSLKESFFSEAISGIEDLAQQHKYHVLIAQSHDDVDREKQVLEAMKNQRVDGVIASLSKHTTDCSHFTDLEHFNIPVVFFDRVPNRTDVNKVYFNMHSGTSEAVEFLYNQGHRRIALVNGPECMSSSIERTHAWKEVMVKKRIKIDMSLVTSTDMTQEGTFAAMETLMACKPRPTAVVAMNDYVALDIIQYARNTKLKVNKDLCVISYANLPITNYLETPPMASVEQYPYQQGAKATEIMMHLLQHHDDMAEKACRHVLINGNLVIHEKKQRSKSIPIKIAQPVV
ncbi:MAG: LacI family DNA-binding transcriptional regulator [Chitinophagaceae bacterium]